MKTWTNPTVEELEVKMTAGGRPWWFWEDLVYGPVSPENPGNPENPGDQEPGKDETTDGQS